jgi:hypothetical protein
MAKAKKPQKRKKPITSERVKLLVRENGIQIGVSNAIIIKKFLNKHPSLDEVKTINQIVRITKFREGKRLKQKDIEFYGVNVFTKEFETEN